MARKKKHDLQYTAPDNGEVTEEKLTRETFPTERRIVRAAIAALELGDWSEDATLDVLDVGAGSGIWGRVFKERFPNAIIHGVEIRDIPKPDDFDTWYVGDFLQLSGQKYDIVIGNIPFSYAESFIPHGLSLLTEGGKVIFLLRAQFNGGQDRYKNFWCRYPLEREYYCVSRMPFIKKLNKQTGLYVPASDVWDYAMFVFSNDWKEDWWTTSRWDFKTNTELAPQLSLEELFG